jgi:hypothetical protein
MTPEVEDAITELREAFSDHAVEVAPDPQGGAYVVVQDLPLGPQYRPERSWVGFAIGFQYPHADVYPHYTDSTLSRVDGAPLGEGMQQPIQWHDRMTTQISRRSTNWNAAEDTATLKLRKVLDWLAHR